MEKKTLETVIEVLVERLDLVLWQVEQLTKENIELRKKLIQTGAGDGKL